ncbi:MAG: glycosyltransferase family 4 protein, partial [Candidatus Muirbacterium halophilum]|nr:glycosyltransferase family 4 protein [Candidatus Muirbacterium halophilum]
DLFTYVPRQRQSKKNHNYLISDKNVLVSHSYSFFEKFFFKHKNYLIAKDVSNKISLKKYQCLYTTYLFSGGYSAFMLSRKYEIPYVVSIRTTDFRLYFEKMIHLRKIGISILLNASAVIFISEAHKKELINTYLPEDIKNNIKEKSYVIPNGINQFWLDNKFTYKKLNKELPIKILYVGRIDSNKNLLTTARAINLLIEAGHQVEYNVIGEIKNKTIYNKLMNYEFVIYKGKLNQEDLIKEYRANDLFVMPSKFETFGLVYAEAMSQGLPIIYTRGQGFDLLFEEGHVGYSVLASDYNDISQKILDIVNRYEILSENCINAVDMFQWEIAAKKYASVFSNIIR